MNREKIWRFVRKPDNLITIITLIVGVILTYLNLKNPNLSNLALAGIVTVLAALAAAQLIGNYQTLEQQERFERMEKRGEEIAREIKSLPIPPGIVLRDRTALPPLESFVGQAKEAFIAGRTLITVASHRDLWRRKLEDGCNLRFVLMSPQALDKLNIQHVLDTSFEGFERDLNSSLEHFRYIKDINHSAKGKMEVRLVNYASNMTILMIDKELPSGAIRVELMPYRCDSRRRPHFDLTAGDKDPRWYHLFRNACEQMWEDATPWEGNQKMEERESGG